MMSFGRKVEKVEEIPLASLWEKGVPSLAALELVRTAG